MTTPRLLFFALLSVAACQAATLEPRPRSKRHAATIGSSEPEVHSTPETETSDPESPEDSEPGPSGTPTETGCPAYATPVTRGNVGTKAAVEVSGMAASRRNPGVLWLHNDSGNDAEVYAVTTTGAARGTIALSGVKMVDWEDIACDAGPDPQLSYVYVADIGDNDENRSKVSIYRFPEPDLSLGSSTVTADRLDVVYPDGPHNAEALLLDPVSKDLFIVTKSSVANVYRVSGLFTNGSKATTAEKVASFSPSGGEVSGGDISPDGREILIRTDNSAMLWRRAAGTPVAQAFAAKHCVVPTAKESNGEAIAFLVDQSGYMTTSEGSSPPLSFFAKK
jgi:hypothetical protein